MFRVKIRLMHQEHSSLRGSKGQREHCYKNAWEWRQSNRNGDQLYR
jgi:hypothetical protein